MENFICRNCGAKDDISEYGDMCVCNSCTSLFIDPYSFTLPTVKFKFFTKEGEELPKEAKLPHKAHEGDSGWDMYISKQEFILPGKAKLLSTNVSCELPENYEFQVRPRSSTPKLLIMIPNSPGTIDNSYIGHMKVWAYNAGTETVYINAGDRICQIVPMRADQLPSEEITENTKTTTRGDKGFGSTGR
jgi:dUTP pyrophosphatase